MNTSYDRSTDASKLPSKSGFLLCISHDVNVIIFPFLSYKSAFLPEFSLFWRRKVQEKTCLIVIVIKVMFIC